jgi:hypothetical protein
VLAASRFAAEFPVDSTLCQQAKQGQTLASSAAFASSKAALHRVAKRTPQQTEQARCGSLRGKIKIGYQS